MVEMKICIECKSELPATAEHFPVDRGRLKTKCRDCTNEYLKQYYLKNREKKLQAFREYYKNNKERHNEKGKQWYEDNKEEVLKQAREYYENNSEHIKKQVKKYRQNNKEKYTDAIRSWKKDNRDKVRIYSQKRKAIKRKLPATLTEGQWASAKKYFNNSCAYCGMTEEEHKEKFNQPLHQEHFIPLSTGGEYTRNNIIPACADCNNNKRANDFFKWYHEQMFYSKEREKEILEYLNYKEEGIQQLSTL